MNSTNMPAVDIAALESGDRTVRLTPPLLWATFVASLGGLLFGFDTVVISGCQQQLKDLFQLTGFEQGFMTASALIGAVLGSLAAAKPGDLYGRRDSLKVAGAFYLLCALGCGLASNLGMLVGFRLLGGIAVGATSVLGPMYLAEISPAAWRGRLVAFFQFNIVLGCLAALFSNYLIGLLNLGATEWRWKLGVQALPALAFFIMLFFVVRSPRWLLMKGLKSEAADVLQKVGAARVDEQITAIEESLRSERSAKSAPLFVRSLAKPIFLAWAVAMFNQLDGINALWYYLNPIFTMAGFNKVSGDLQSVILGVANLLATMAGMAIIDRAGRKPLLVWGAVGTGVCMGLVAWVFNGTEHHGWLVWLLVGFVVCHAFGQGAVIWVYISEIFPNAVRGKGQTLGSFTHWFMAMVISWTFPMLARDAGQPNAGLPFAFFAVMMIVQVVVVLKFFPETKRVSLEQMQTRLSQGK